MELNNKIASSSISNSNQPIKDASFMSTMDQCYLEMIQLVHLLGSAFVSPHFWKGGNAFDNTSGQLVTSLNKLAQMPGHNGGVLIREKTAYGSQSNKNVARYTIHFSNIILNTEVAAEVARRLETSVTQLLRKLQIAFDIFSLVGIRDLYLRTPDVSKDNVEQIRISLEILSHFDQAVQSGTDIVYHLNDQRVTLPVIKGAHDQADPNLTIVAALNQLSAVDMEEINKKVTAYIEQHHNHSVSRDKCDVFTVMFYIKDLKEMLILPPLEINNTESRLTCSEIESITTTDKPLNKNYNRHENSINSSINDHLPVKGEDHKLEENLHKDEGHITKTDSVVNKLNEVNDLLALIENTVLREEILNSIIISLKECLQQVQEDEFDLVESAESDTFSNKTGKFHAYISGIFSRFNEKPKGETKAFSGDRKGTTLKELDHEQIAKQFDLTISETKKILPILEGCFDSKGHFIRFEFENKVPDFIVFESKIFKFLWGYLDKHLHRKDRVAFFNSLYLLVSNMNQPQEVLFFLLDELYKDPSRISYSDRNALMLASLLLRSYNKEYSVDIELTPGEVLLVKDGLNENMLRFASMRIDEDKELIKKKLETIHDRLINAFDDQKPKPIAWTPHFLLSLEREAFIFLSLVAGETVRQILISTLSGYGNPKSKIYDVDHQEKDLALLLQQLKLLIRGLGRVGDIEDLGILADLKKNEDDFSAMHASSQHRKIVNQVFGMIDIAMGNITSLS